MISSDNNMHTDILLLYTLHEAESILFIYPVFLNM
jgi:hypothetical protein